ncbi:MAG: hypothetical protein J0M24_05125 [Verrucomicrobia bacterium]|nr:hypothetical protein [Verrucomicrobiota bacterium]
MTGRLLLSQRHLPSWTILWMAWISVRVLALEFSSPTGGVPPNARILPPLTVDTLDGSYALSNATNGVVIFDFPDSTRPAQPVPEFLAKYQFGLVSGGADNRTSLTFHYGNPLAGDGTNATSEGLRVVISRQRSILSDQKQLQVLWNNQVLVSSNFPAASDLVFSGWCQVTVSNQVLNVVLSPLNESTNITAVQDLPLTWLPDASWRFGLSFASGMLDGSVDAAEVEITGYTAPFISSPLGDRAIWQDSFDDVPLTVDSLENVSPANIAVTLESSDPDLLPPGNLSVQTDSANSRTLLVAPAPGKTGVATLTVRLESGGGLPTGTVSYALTVKPNTPPSVSSLGGPFTQPFGITRVIPFTIGSEQWSSEHLRLNLSADPGLIQSYSLFAEPLDASGNNYNLVFTPNSSSASGTVSVQVIDGAGLTATSSFTLTNAPVPLPPVTLGAGSALAVNLFPVFSTFPLDLPVPDQYVAEAGASDVVGGTVTVEAWVWATQFFNSSFNALVCLGAPGTGINLGFTGNGTPALFGGANNFVPDDPAYRIRTNEWHHVAAVVSGQAVTLFVDGQVSASGTLPAPLNMESGSIYIGDLDPNGIRRPFSGFIDNVRIWSEARSNGEILANYQSPVASDAPNLLRYYRFEEGFSHFDGANPDFWKGQVLGGDVIVDSSIHSRSARLVGHPSFVPGASEVSTVNLPEDQTTRLGLGALVNGNTVSGTAGLTRELFFGPLSSLISSGLLRSPGWPDRPDVVLALGTGLEMPVQLQASVGQRYKGFLLPPETGSYQFAIASAQEGQLWISTDESTNNLVAVASSPANGVGFRRFDVNPSLQQGSRNLIAGQRYYFEVRHQADSGVNGRPHLSVRWTLPSGLVELPIPAYRIQPVGTPSPGQPLAIQTLINPRNGSGTVSNGFLLYQPSANLVGTDTYGYFATNGPLVSAPVLLNLNIVNKDDAPVAGSQFGLELDGSSAGVVSQDNFNLTGQSFTVELWARRASSTPPVSNQTQTLWSLQDSAPSASIQLAWQPDGRVGVVLTGQGGDQPSPPPLISQVPLLDTNWHHWAVTFDARSNRVELFRDATSLSATNYGPGTFGVTNVKFFLGSLAGAAGSQFTGTVDEVRLWKRVVSPEDLAANNGVPLTGTEDDLLIYYRLDEGNGLVAYDSSAPKTGNVSLDATLLDPVAWVPGITNFLQIPIPRNSPGTTVYLPGFDFERDPLTYQIISPTPQNGRLIATGIGRYTYIPNTNFTGADPVTYTVTAGGKVSQPYTITLNVDKGFIPPTISSIRDLELEEEDPSPTVNFTVGDVDDPSGNSLTVVVRSSNESLLPLSSIVLSGSGTQRTVTLNPVDGEIGTSSVELEVSNGSLSAKSQFNVRVNPRLIYVAVNVGETTDQPSSFATSLNDQGQLAGWVAGVASATNSQPFFYSGYNDSSATFITLNLGGSIGGAFDLNNSGIMVGAAADAQGNLHAFQIQPGQDTQPTDLGTLLGGTESVATAINDSGQIVGYAQAPDGTYRAFTAGTGPMTALPLGTNVVSQWATTVNSSGQIAGYNLDAAGTTNAFLYSLGEFVDLGQPTNALHVVATTLTDEGTVYGQAVFADSVTRAVKWDSGQWTVLGDFLNGGKTEVLGANRYGQVVGRSLTNGVWHAVLYTEGQAYDLNARQASDSPWTLINAVAINDLSQIAATGSISNGPPQALLLFPATEIGRRVFRPEGTLPLLPDITILKGNGGDDKKNSFHWSTVDQKLFALRPVVAEIRWRTGTYVVITNLTEFGDNVIRQKATNEVLISTLSFNVWPTTPDLHVVDTPVQLQPNEPGFEYGFVEIAYTTADRAQVEPSTKTFTSTGTGFSVLHYLKTGGQPLNPQLQSDAFQVTRSVRWNDPLVLVSNVSWTIGVPLTNALHDDYPGLNGYVLFTNAPYDGAGPNAAYDRTTRQGTILAVNTNSAPSNFVVVWYRQNRLGVSWSGYPYQYLPQWPTNAPTIVIASGQGSGLLPANRGNQTMVYEQSDPTLPGFNPNEEHALISGGVLYALRSDLNHKISPQASEPFSLLKYLDPVSGEWRMQVYAVVAQTPELPFRYSALAGNLIQPPAPISLLPLSARNRFLSGPAWTNVTGQIYARAAGADGGSDTVVMQYYYPLQPGFYYDLTRNGQPAYQVGDAVPWLDQLPGQVAGTPIQVLYKVEWPVQSPALQVGQSLTTATGGLPDILDMAAAQIIFDSQDPRGDSPITAAARLYDPLSPRVIALDPSFQFPTSIQRTVDPATGFEVFTDLPYFLRVRLFHDPRNRQLGFRGFIHTPADGGAPITLLNVMNKREQQVILNLDTTGSASYQNALRQLYQKTRNPNDIDQDANGLPDDGLLIGLTTQTVTNLNGVTNLIVAETLQGPKALTVGQPLSPLIAPPSAAVTLNGTTGGLEIGAIFSAVTNDFTIEFWVRPEAARLETVESDVVVNGLSGQLFAIYPTQGSANYGSGHLGTGVSVGTNGVSVFFHGDNILTSALVYATNLTGWHHLAVVVEGARPVLYVDGSLARVGLGMTEILHPSADVSTSNSNSGNYGPFPGSISDLRIWNYNRSADDIAANRFRRLTGAEAGLAGLWRIDDGEGNTASNATVESQPGTLVGGYTWTTNAPPHDPGDHFVVIAENNDASLAGLPVDLHVIRIDESLARGALAVIESDDVLDQRVTLRHSADFAGQPESFVFEWYYQADSPGFDATLLPSIAPDGSVTNVGFWISYPDQGAGINDVTLGSQDQSGLLVLSDTWWIMRYGFTQKDGTTLWSGWVGDPSGTASAPRAMLVPGWIKRVLEGINLFAQRTSDFEDNTVNVLASTIAEAGPRYIGDVALNPNVLDNFGLIAIYQTILNRGRSLSIDGTPAVDYPPANSALLLAAGNIAELYLLHANEAFADAADPTIGLTTDSTEMGSIASSVFAFQNQVGSLLEEELAMLRGRDDSSAGVGADPVYNRLYWNFTGGDGETAYVAKYGIPDQNGDGFITAVDAKLLYPQGHGDAWGHYLTALTTYYDLLRHPNFTWTNNTQSTLVAGVPVQVNYQDERRFASAAAAKARTGAEIMDRTWRLNYSGDPVVQFRGDFDVNPTRAWSTTDWGRRAAQGAYFDWVAGNAILPPVDTVNTGIQRVDRTTVVELAQIVTETAAVTTVLDQADTGLNPSGLARGVVTFDLDPDLLRTGFSRETHFEQIYDRAVRALQNAETVFNRATQLSSELRQQQNSVSDYSVAVANQESDYRNQLIQLFGTPYSGTIGAGQPYPSGYDGPDLLYWNYVDTLDVTSSNNPRGADFLDLWSNFTTLKTDWGAQFSAGTWDLLDSSTNRMMAVTYPIYAGDYAFQAPPTWGTRRTEGDLQANVRALVLAQAQLRENLQAYQTFVTDLAAQADFLAVRYQLKQDQLNLLLDHKVVVGTFDGLIQALKIASTAASGVKDDIDEATFALMAAVPGVEGLSDDGFAFIRGLLYLAGNYGAGVPEAIVGVSDISQTILEFAKSETELGLDYQTEVNSQTYDVREQVKDLEVNLRQEPGLRLILFQAQQSLVQAARTLEASLAEGQRILTQRTAFRQATAGTVQADRYRDLGLRIFRNDALEKYDTQFQLAARYVHLAAAAYDYELNLGDQSGAGSVLGAQIVRERNLGELAEGEPIVGRVGLASILGQMRQNFAVLKGQLGLNNDRPENSRFSLRTEAFRILPVSTNADPNLPWRAFLQQSTVSNLWDVPEFRRYCRSFAPESAGPQPGIVLRFSTTIAAGQNFFGWPLLPLDSSYDPSEYSTRIKSVAVWLSDYDAAGLASKPRVYLVPAGADRLRASAADDFTIHNWQVLDQRIPVPFPITEADLDSVSALPTVPALDGSFSDIRRHSAFRAYQDATFDLNEFNESSRLVGRSVWNTEWVLIIPGAYLLGDSNLGLTRFIDSVTDIKLYFQTTSASGN